jgi:hypothetical protein
MELTIERVPEVPVRPRAEALYIVVRYQPCMGTKVPAGPLDILHNLPWVMGIEVMDYMNAVHVTCYAGECDELVVDPVNYIFNYLKGWEFPA